MQGGSVRNEVRQDIITAAPLERLAALLDYNGMPWAAGDVPPLAHWLFHLPDARQSTLGPDGHPLPGRFMPPVAQPRRMWAGSRVAFPGALHVGDAIERQSSIANVADKGGNPGDAAVRGLERAAQGSPPSRQGRAARGHG